MRYVIAFAMIGIGCMNIPRILENPGNWKSSMIFGYIIGVAFCVLIVPKR